jgi:beta-galactosidase GanA
MDPQRIPPEYWRDRFSKARAMGLNTTFSYVFWNLREPVPGIWTSSEPINDIAAYFRIAQEEGLHVVLRPNKRRELYDLGTVHGTESS